MSYTPRSAITSEGDALTSICPAECTVVFLSKGRSDFRALSLLVREMKDREE